MGESCHVSPGLRAGYPDAGPLIAYDDLLSLHFRHVCLRVKRGNSSVLLIQ